MAHRSGGTLVLFVLTLTAALSGSTACVKIASNENLKVQAATEPVSLDPAFAEDGAALRILSNTMDGLVGYDGRGKLQPRLAKRYRISKDGRRVEFTLRPNIKWSDGPEIHAEEFVDGLRRALGPGSVSKLAPLLFVIKNAKLFNQGKLPAEALGVKASGNLLVFTLESAAPHFIHTLTLPAALPIRNDILQKHSGRWPNTAPGTGPYYIRSHAQDKKFILEKNPFYFLPNEGPPVVELIQVSDESTALHLFEKNKLDIVNKIPFTEYGRLRKSGYMRSDPFLATYFIAFNTRKPPFDKREWRRAVAAAINKTQITTVLDSGEAPASSWLPLGLEGHSPFVEPDHRLDGAIDRAKKLSLNSPVISAGFDSSARNSLVMEKIQRDVFEKLDLRLVLQNLDWKTYIKTLQTDPPSIFRFGWQAPFLDPLPHLTAFSSRDPNNYTGWKHSRYDELVEAISHMPNGPARDRKIKEADAILVAEEAIVIPLYHYMQNHAVAPRVSAFQVNPFGVIRYDEIRLKK